MREVRKHGPGRDKWPYIYYCMWGPMCVVDIARLQVRNWAICFASRNLVGGLVYLLRSCTMKRIAVGPVFPVPGIKYG